MRLRQKWLGVLGGVFFVSFSMSLAMALKARAGNLQVSNPYLYLVAPGSLLLGAVLLFVVAHRVRHNIRVGKVAKVELSEIVEAFCRAFAFWFLAMSMLLTIGLVKGRTHTLRLAELAAALSATAVYVIYWLRSRPFSWWGLMPGAAFVYLILRSAK
jgi:TRAP-type C4-dicarboxylate transport system permease large subunit